MVTWGLELWSCLILQLLEGHLAVNRGLSTGGEQGPVNWRRTGACQLTANRGLSTGGEQGPVNWWRTGACQLAANRGLSTGGEQEPVNLCLAPGLTLIQTLCTIVMTPRDKTGTDGWVGPLDLKYTSMRGFISLPNSFWLRVFHKYYVCRLQKK